MSKRICVAIAVVIVWASGPLPGQADQINLAGNTAASTPSPASDVGNFSGTLTYTDISATSATLTVTLTNTDLQRPRSAAI